MVIKKEEIKSKYKTCYWYIWSYENDNFTQTI